MAHLPAVERRAQIVAATIHILATEGLASTTTRRIAEHAGVPLGIIHYVFASKDSIFEAVIDDFAERGRDIFDSVPPGIGLVEGINARAAIFVDWLLAEPEVHLAQYELLYWAIRTPDKRHLAQRLFNRYFELDVRSYRLSAGLDERQEIVVLDDVARLAISLFDGLALQYLAFRDEPAIRVLSRNQARLVAHQASLMLETSTADGSAS